MVMNVSNAFAGIFGFFIGLVLNVAMTPIILPIIELIEDTITKLIALFGFYAIVIVICIYLPLALATSTEEKRMYG